MLFSKVIKHDKYYTPDNVGLRSMLFSKVIKLTAPAKTSASVFEKYVIW